jgi:hypothetical protein
MYEKQYSFGKAVELLSEDNSLEFETESEILKFYGSCLCFNDKQVPEMRKEIYNTDLLKTYTIIKKEKLAHPLYALKALTEEGRRIKIVKADDKVSIIKPTDTYFEFNIDDIKNGKWYILG